MLELEEKFHSLLKEQLRLKHLGCELSKEQEQEGRALYTQILHHYWFK